MAFDSIARIEPGGGDMNLIVFMLFFIGLRWRRRSRNDKRTSFKHVSAYLTKRKKEGLLVPLYTKGHGGSHNHIIAYFGWSATFGVIPVGWIDFSKITGLEFEEGVDWEKVGTPTVEWTGDLAGSGGLKITPQAASNQAVRLYFLGKSPATEPDYRIDFRANIVENAAGINSGVSFGHEAMNGEVGMIGTNNNGGTDQVGLRYGTFAVPVWSPGRSLGAAIGTSNDVRAWWSFGDNDDATGNYAGQVIHGNITGGVPRMTLAAAQDGFGLGGEGTIKALVAAAYLQGGGTLTYEITKVNVVWAA